MDVVWHLGNLFAPAWGVSALLALLLRVGFRRQPMSLKRLILWGGAGGSLATLGALALWGRDGTMAGYALLLTGISLPQWWQLRR